MAICLALNFVFAAKSNNAPAVVSYENIFPATPAVSTDTAKKENPVIADLPLTPDTSKHHADTVANVKHLSTDLPLFPDASIRPAASSPDTLLDIVPYEHAKAPYYPDQSWAKDNKSRKSVEADPFDNSQYSPFNYSATLSISPAVSGFYYNERIRLSDAIASYERAYGRAPDVIIGSPKSTEYGACPGVTLSLAKLFAHGILFKPSISILFGIENTYSGSTQGQSYLDDNGNAVGIIYTPVDSNKMNIFVNAEVNIGYCNNSHFVNFAFLSGLRFSLWHRDMFSSSDISNYENYFWFNIPVGLNLYIPAGQKSVVGLEANADLMFYGGMKANESLRNSPSYYVDFPTVDLGNKAGYRIRLVAQRRMNKHLAIKFAPYYAIYGFGKSNTGTATLHDPGNTDDKTTFTFFEPESATMWWGLDLTFVLHYSPIRRQTK